MSVSGGSVTEATISHLMSSTTYSIQVAAVNSAGIGNYSDLLIVQTESKCILLMCSVFLRVYTCTCAVIMHIPCLFRYIPQSQ